MSSTELIHPEWPAPPSVHALVTTRGLQGRSAPPYARFNLGAHCGDDDAAVAFNRARLVELAGLPQAPHWLAQVHGTHVQRVVRAAPEDAPAQADAAVTRLCGAVLAILTADCLPVLFAARDGSEIGAAHAGWRGLAAGVLEATVAAMHARPADIVAWLGPAAGPHRYEIGDEVRHALLAPDPAAGDCFQPTRPGHWRVDLYGLARHRLASAGVGSVHGGRDCTISDPDRFYSHRRDARTGRMASLIWINP